MIFSYSVSVFRAHKYKSSPAVVITETKDKYADLVLSSITSMIPAVLNQNEIALDPSSNNGLRVQSIIKVDKIFTLKKNKVVHRLGKISENELIQFKTIFKALVD